MRGCSACAPGCLSAWHDRCRAGAGCRASVTAGTASCQPAHWPHAILPQWQPTPAPLPSLPTLDPTSRTRYPVAPSSTSAIRVRPTAGCLAAWFPQHRCPPPRRGCWEPGSQGVRHQPSADSTHGQRACSGDARLAGGSLCNEGGRPAAASLLAGLDKPQFASERWSPPAHACDPCRLVWCSSTHRPQA